MKDCFFSGTFKIESVPGMIKKKCYPSLSINLHNQLKKYYLGNFGNLLLYVY